MELLYTDDKGETTKYTADMLINAIKTKELFNKENTNLTEELKRIYDKLSTIRGVVYDFFNERYETGTTTIECEVDDVNALLESIGSTRLKRLFEVSGTVTFTIAGIEAESSDDAETQVMDYLNYEWSGNEGEVAEWDVEVTRAREE